MRAYAIETSHTWDFTNPANYTYDNGKIEPNNNNLRLSLLDKIENFTAAGGKLQSNKVLDVAADSTYYFVSTDLGIDVLRQDTWERTGYITAGGGFPTITAESGYLYAGKNGGIYRWQISSLGNNTPLGSYRYTTSTSPALGNNNVLDIDAEVLSGKTYLAVGTQTHIHLIKDETGTPGIYKSSAGYIYGTRIVSDGTLYYAVRDFNGLNPDSPIMVKYNATTIAADWAYNAVDVYYSRGWFPGATKGPATAYATYRGLHIGVGTSTANAGDNTIIVETDDGLSVIQENRTTVSQSTVKNFTSDSRGSAVTSSASAFARYYNGTNIETATLDSDPIWTSYNSLYYLRDRSQELEYDLGSQKTFNYLRQWFSGNLPNGYTMESSTHGTSANIASGATALSKFGSYYSNHPDNVASKVNDNYVSTYFWSATGYTAYPSQTIEQVFTSPTSVGSVDLQFTDEAHAPKDYFIESSDEATEKLSISSANASSSYLGYVPSQAFDVSPNTIWHTNITPSTSTPQWLSADLGSEQSIKGISFISGADGPKDFTIEYSNDNSNWITADTVTNNSESQKVIVFSSAVNARYLRINITASKVGPGVSITELEIYKTMFEAGNPQTLDTVTNNSELSRVSTFNNVTAKAFRIRATSPNGASTYGLGIREFKMFADHFDKGQVTQLATANNMSNGLLSYGTYFKPNHGISFPTTTAQHIRIKYQKPLTYGDISITQVRLFDTTMPQWFPEGIVTGAYDASSNKYFGLLNSGVTEDGRIIQIDGATSNSPTVGQVIDKTTKPDLASDEFSALHIADSNTMIAGTTDGGASFIGKRRVTDSPTITSNIAFNPPAVASWKTFTENASKNGGEIYYQISNDDGTTWYFYNGSTWTTAGATDHNTAVDINAHIEEFPIGSRQFKWKAFLSSNGAQDITLQSVTVTINPDINPPTSNADNIAMYQIKNGAQVPSEGWATGNTPDFTWDPAQDDGNPGASGIKGYCLYLGQSELADPVSDKGILGSSPLDTDGTCPFAIATTELDLAVSGYLGSALSSSTDPYFLHIKALDHSHNVFVGGSETFSFKFDNTAPAAPGFISAPSQFLATRDVTLTWPTTGSESANDAHSGLLGLQYRIGGEGIWYGANHNGNQDTSDILPNNGSYRTDATYDYPNLIEGNNIIYFRGVDQAGNFSTTYTTAVIKINTSAPSSPRNVTVSPVSNTDNAFSFDWDEPSSFVGQPSSLEYCYTINTLPTINTCNFTSAGQTSLPTGPYATQPGDNTFYVVAKDEANNINYATASSVTFTANTSAPGMPTNVEIADVSTKATSNWKVALSWAVPVDQGSGVATYKVMRSTDGNSFAQIATTAGLSYVDGGLSQTRYYYKISACDSANNCGAYSTVTNIIPTGKFTEPAEMLSNPVVSEVTTKRAKITWVTNRESDSKIAIGTSSGSYFASEISNSSQVTSHIVDLDNLKAGTTYFFVARWTDEDGNTGVSNEISFTTAPAPIVKNVKVIKTTLNSATVQFTSEDASKALVYYGKTDAFGGKTEINTSLSESTYQVELNGLDDGASYVLRISLLDSEGGEYTGDIYSFTTPPRPAISNLKFQPVKDQPTSTQLVSWTTNVPTSSTVNYGKNGTEGKTIANSKLVTEHEMTINDLQDNSDYFLIAESRDVAGNLATSDRQTFKTALDTRPPKISNLRIEASIKGTGVEARGQAVVSWTTDEQDTSQVAYGQGASLQNLNNRTGGANSLTTEHVVIVSDLSTSSVYTMQPVSRDGSNNEAQGSTKSAIIGKASESIISIVLNALRGIFGF
ncbi:discoidin domain-containing protein [bacterium]|nr:discoidin domain-containing protein [bacterium]